MTGAKWPTRVQDFPGPPGVRHSLRALEHRFRRPHIYALQSLFFLPILLPPLSEQRAITAVLAITAAMDGVEAAVEVAWDERDRLRLLK